MNLLKRSVTSVGWNVGANSIKLAAFFVRTTLLLRWIPEPAIFGTYAAASAWIGVTIILSSFGMQGAFLHRAPETEDEDEAAAVHFTLKLVFTLVWAVLFIGGALLFTDGALRFAMLFLAVTQGLGQLAQTPRLILIRRVVHRRLSILELVNAFLNVGLSLFLAYRGHKLTALLYPAAATTISTLLFLYVWRPVWRPRLSWSRSVVRYFLDFGRKNVVAAGLLRALNDVDDLFTNAALGEVALGFYSRAYRYATYPRQILAMPINMVAGGTYAELKGDRLRLSKAFFRVNSFLVRSGFLLAGALALIAPEFIRLGPGSAWLPMLDAFRLMLVFAMLDPIKLTLGHLFVAVGQPQRVVWIRAIQLIVLLVGLFLLGPRLGIVGVALAVDIMLFVGIGLLLWQARPFVDFSGLKMFLAPVAALIIALLGGWALVLAPGMPDSDWVTAVAKLVVFSLLYSVILVIFERQSIKETLESIIQNARF